MTGTRPGPIILPSWTGFLGAYASVAPGPLFPFPLTCRPGPAELVALQQAGLILGNGVPTPEFAAGLQVMAQAVSCARLRLLADGALSDTAVYFAPAAADGGETAALRRLENGFRLDCPGATGDLLAALNDLLGQSEVTTLACTIALPTLPALAALALVDLTRRTMFTALAEDRALPAPTIGLDELTNTLGRQDLHPRWLLWTARHLLRQPLPAPGTAEVLAALQTLQAQGLARPAGPGWQAGEALELLAARLLVPRQFLRLEARRLQADGTTSGAAFAVIQGDHRNLLHLEEGPGTLLFQGLTATAVAALVGLYLTDPDAIPAAGRTTAPPPPPPPPPPPGHARAGREASGSRPRKAGGRRGRPEVRFCPSCGGQLDPGARFCSACGAASD